MRYNSTSYSILVLIDIIIAVMSKTMGSKGLVWHTMTDLRIHDSAPVIKAYSRCDEVFHAFFFGPDVFKEGNGGVWGMMSGVKLSPLRLRFLCECLQSVDSALRETKADRGLQVVRSSARDALPQLTKELGVKTVYCHSAYGTDEDTVLDATTERLREIGVSVDVSAGGAFLTEAPHDKLPLASFSEFRKAVEVRADCYAHLPADSYALLTTTTTHAAPVEPLDADTLFRRLSKEIVAHTDDTDAEGSGFAAYVADEAWHLPEQDSRAALQFVGGTAAALARTQHYCDLDLAVAHGRSGRLGAYKRRRNGMMGNEYSTKLSPWLAHGCITPRQVCTAIKAFEDAVDAEIATVTASGNTIEVLDEAVDGFNKTDWLKELNDRKHSAYWVKFELLWRDYAHLVTRTLGPKLFHLGGSQGPSGAEKHPWVRDRGLFERWTQGRTGYPFIDANMRELSLTGYMSNRGRQVVASFFVRDCGLDWRLGAQHFEKHLLDHDVSSNYANWQYISGVGMDPREDRYFNVVKQAKVYDPSGAFMRLWLPELKDITTAALQAPHTELMGEERRRTSMTEAIYPRPMVDLLHPTCDERSVQRTLKKMTQSKGHGGINLD